MCVRVRAINKHIELKILIFLIQLNIGYIMVKNFSNILKSSEDS